MEKVYATTLDRMKRVEDFPTFRSKIGAGTVRGNIKGIALSDSAAHTLSNSL